MTHRDTDMAGHLGGLLAGLAEALIQKAKAENRASRTKRFNEALDAMKAMAEAN